MPQNYVSKFKVEYIRAIKECFWSGVRLRELLRSRGAFLARMMCSATGSFSVVCHGSSTADFVFFLHFRTYETFVQMHNGQFPDLQNAHFTLGQLISPIFIVAFYSYHIHIIVLAFSIFLKYVLDGSG